MSDTITGGFGASLSGVVLARGPNEINARVIAAPSEGSVSILQIMIGGWESSGATSTVTFLPVFVVRSRNTRDELFLMAKSARPDGLVAKGFCSPGQLAANNFDLLFQALIRVQSMGRPINFAEGLLKAENGERLIVVASSAVDNTAIGAPQLLSTASTLSVGGVERATPINRKLR